MSNARRILIAGCGFVGAELARLLRARGHDVWGLARSQPLLPPGATWVSADLTDATSLSNLPNVDYAVFCASSGEASDERYRRVYVEGLSNLQQALRGSDLRRLCFVSSTAVYHQTDGEWVDESSPTHPSHFAGIRTLEAEAVASASSVPSVVLRCGGIYGPGRRRLIESVAQGRARWAPGSPRFTNRIHRDDVAGALAHLLFHPAPERLYVGVDEAPAPEREVFDFLAERLGVPPPTAELNDDMQRSGGNKRCSSRLLRQSGYSFVYPSFREGYGAMLASESHPTDSSGR